MFTSYRLIPRWLMRRIESSMSGWTPFGMVTPITRSTPRASTQRPATTELSLPPEMPMTALHPGPFSSNQSRIHWTHASLTFFASNIFYFALVYTWMGQPVKSKCWRSLFSRKRL